MPWAGGVTIVKVNDALGIGLTAVSVIDFEVSSAVVTAWPSVPGGLTPLMTGFDRVFNCIGHVGEEVVTRHRFNCIDRGQVSFPGIVSDSLDVRHVHCDGSRAGSHARYIVVALRNDEDDFPRRRRNGYVTVSDRRGETIAACATASAGPATTYTSFAGKSVLRKFSRSAHGP